MGTDAVIARLERIERENRRLRRLVGGLAAIVVGAVMMVAFAWPSTVAAQSGEVWATRFVLVDDSGKMLADLAVMADGQPRFTMWEKPGAGTAEPSVPRFGIGVVPTSRGGGAYLSMGQKELGDVLLRTYRDGTMPFVQIYRTGGAAIWAAP